MSENLKVNSSTRTSIDVVVSLNDRRASIAATKATKPPSTPKPNSKFKFRPRKQTETEFEETHALVHRYRPKPIEELVKETRFTKKEIQSLYRGFKQECPSGIVNEASFKEIYAHYFPQGDCSAYAHFLFCSIDQNADGSVNFEDFLHGLSILVRGSIDEKLRWIFNLYDINGDGKITKDEVQSIVESVYDLMGRFTDPPIDTNTSKAHVEHIFKKLDIHQTGSVTLEQFLKACYNDSSIINSISTMDTLI